MSWLTLTQWGSPCIGATKLTILQKPSLPRLQISGGGRQSEAFKATICYINYLLLSSASFAGRRTPRFDARRSLGGCATATADVCQTSQTAVFQRACIKPERQYVKIWKANFFVNTFSAQKTVQVSKHSCGNVALDGCAELRTHL